MFEYMLEYMPSVRHTVIDDGAEGTIIPAHRRGPKGLVEKKFAM